MYRQLFYPFCIDFSFLSTESVAQVNADLQLRLDKTLDSMRIRIKSAALSGVWFCQMEVCGLLLPVWLLKTRLHRRGLIN